MASRWQLALLVSLFVLWGACNSLNDLLIRQVKKAFSLTDTASSLVQVRFRLKAPPLSPTMFPRAPMGIAPINHAVFFLSFSNVWCYAVLPQTAFYGGYLVGAMPAAAFARRFGYRRCVCFGLAFVCLGSSLFYPAARCRYAYPALLTCLYVPCFRACCQPDAVPPTFASCVHLYANAGV